MASYVAGEVNAAFIRQGYVHHHQVRREFLGHPQPFSPVSGLPDYFESGVARYKGFEAFPEKGMVVNNQDFFLIGQYCFPCKEPQ